MQIRDRFWTTWVFTDSYLLLFKWYEYTKLIAKGDLVLICDPNVPRRQWKRGRVEKLYAGADGQIRRAYAILDQGYGEVEESIHEEENVMEYST